MWSAPGAPLPLTEGAPDPFPALPAASCASQTAPSRLTMGSGAQHAGAGRSSLRGSGPARGAVTGSVALLLSCCGPGGLLGTIQWARALPSLKMKWPITQTFFP